MLCFEEVCTSVSLVDNRIFRVKAIAHWNCFHWVYRSHATLTVVLRLLLWPAWDNTHWWLTPLAGLRPMLAKEPFMLEFQIYWDQQSRGAQRLQFYTWCLSMLLSGLILSECKNAIFTLSIGTDMAIDNQCRCECIRARQRNIANLNPKKSYGRNYLLDAFTSFLKYMVPPT